MLGSILGNRVLRTEDPRLLTGAARYLADLPFEQLAGFEVTRLGNRHKAEKAIKAQDPRGRAIWWIGNAGAEQDCGPGTDFHAIGQGKVSITPIDTDLTHHRALENVGKWARGLVKT